MAGYPIDILSDYKTGQTLIVDGDLVFTSTAVESLAQRLEIRLNVWQGEWSYDETFGTPYRQRILGGGVTKEQIDAELVRVIKLEEDVLAILDLDSRYSVYQRHYELKRVTVVTKDGEVTVPTTFALNTAYPTPPDIDDNLICPN